MILTAIPDNAYVSGLNEDLGLHGNELVQLQTMYTIGAVVGQLPLAMYILSCLSVVFRLLLCQS